MFSNHNKSNKLEINSKKITRNPPTAQKLRSTFLYDTMVQKIITMEIIEYFKLNDNKNMTKQNLRNAS